MAPGLARPRGPASTPRAPPPRPRSPAPARSSGRCSASDSTIAMKTMMTAPPAEAIASPARSTAWDTARSTVEAQPQGLPVAEQEEQDVVGPDPEQHDEQDHRDGAVGLEVERPRSPPRSARWRSSRPGRRSQMGRAHAMTLRKISASRTTMSNRVTMLTTARRLLGRLLGVQRLGRRARHARAEVGPLDQWPEVDAQLPGVLDGSRVEGVLARLDLHEDRLHQPVLRTPGWRRQCPGCRSSSVEPLDDGGHLGLVVLGQRAAVLPVEDHDRADLTAAGGRPPAAGERLTDS